jgi:hypothetical protein
VVVQLAIEMYSLPVSTANGFKLSFIKMSDRDLIFFYLFCQTESGPTIFANSACNFGIAYAHVQFTLGNFNTLVL